MNFKIIPLTKTTWNTPYLPRDEEDILRGCGGGGGGGDCSNIIKALKDCPDVDPFPPT